MAPTPYNVRVTSAFTELNEFNIQGLYLYRTFGADANQGGINNWEVYDGPGQGAKLVARAPGYRIQDGERVSSFSLVFVDERFSGSTFEVRGSVISGTGDWAVVGGTGQFAMATGVISQKLYKESTNKVTDIIELTIRAFCPPPKGTTRYAVTKIGPWGGSGGSPMDIKEAPMRLESITVYAAWVVDSIAFSYIDYTGQKRSSGRWGGSGGRPFQTIQLGQSEVVTEVSGTVGCPFSGDTKKYITTIKFVTNLNKTYGPWGGDQGTGKDVPFTIPVQVGSGIVGFFARGGSFLEAIGVYVRPL